MFERFTEDARRVIVLAQEESRLLGHRDIRAEHLLLGLLRVDDQMARTVLGVTLAAAHRAVAESSPPNSLGIGAHIPFARNAKRAMELGADESQRSGDSTGTAHLLLGVLGVRDQQVEQVLTSLGVDLDEALASVRALVPFEAASHGEPRPRAGDDRPTGAFVADPPPSKRWGPHHDALVAALHRFGRHDEDCGAPESSCTCGFDDALAEADRGPQPG